MRRKTIMAAGSIALFLLCSVLVVSGAWAQDPKTEAEGIWTRDKLTGDWRGLRTDLEKHGIGLDLRFSQFYQGVTSGGVETNSEYGVKLDTFINIDAQKLFGSWKGLYISGHVETRDGKDILSDAGTTTLPNTALLYPLPGDYDDTDVTSLFATQVLFDGKAAILGGKLGSMDLLQGMFPSLVDYGLDGFMGGNSIMSILSWGRWLTLSQYGAGAWTIADGMPSTGIILTGTENTSDSWPNLDDSFSDGFGILAFHRFLFEIDDKKGYLYVGGGGSTKDYPSLDFNDLSVSGEGIGDEEKNPYGIAFYLYQVLWQAEPDNDKRRVQLFTGFTISDDNPSFSDFDVFASIQTFGLFAPRPHDRMGIAGHYYHYADDYVDLVNSIPGSNIRDNSWTTEIFYNYQVTPWLHLTPNAQYSQNENDDDDPAVILGARLVIDI